MIMSMTGFSNSIISLPVKDQTTGMEYDVQLSMTLKTLNSRFFGVNCRIPTSLGFLEAEAIKNFKQELHRGTVQFTIYMSSPTELTGVIEPALFTVKGYLSTLKKIQTEGNVPGTVSMTDLITLNNIFETKETPLSESTINQLRSDIKDLTDNCVLVRTEEGKALEKDIKDRISLLSKYMSELELRVLKVTKEKKAQLIENLKNVLQEAAPDMSPESQISTIYNQLEKLDIHEEIVRFKTHVETLRRSSLPLISSKEKRSTLPSKNYSEKPIPSLLNPLMPILVVWQYLLK